MEKMVKVCVPVEKDDEVTFQLMAKWWAKEIPWGFKEVDFNKKLHKPKS